MVQNIHDDITECWISQKWQNLSKHHYAPTGNCIRDLYNSTTGDNHTMMITKIWDQRPRTEITRPTTCASRCQGQWQKSKTKEQNLYAQWTPMTSNVYPTFSVTLLCIESTYQLHIYTSIQQPQGSRPRTNIITTIVTSWGGTVRLEVK